MRHVSNAVSKKSSIGFFSSPMLTPTAALSHRRLVPANTSQYCPDCSLIAESAAAAVSTQSPSPALIPSTKITVMLDLLMDIAERSKRTEKTIVFSQVRAIASCVDLAGR